MNCINENLKLTAYLKRYNLLYSKITPPDNVLHAVLRNDCIGKLQESEWQLATITAPAGFGKSNIIQQYINCTKNAACWFSVDRDENNTHRFIYYLIAAIKNVAPGFSDDLIDSIRLLNDNLCIFADKFLHEIADMAESVVIVLDDYHHIQNPTLHSFIQYLIYNAPQNLRLIIASREKLPFKVARLRMERKLIEIERDELRFNKDEICSLLESFYHEPVDELQIKNAEAVTEGWPAALQLLCMSSNNIQNLSECLDKENNESFSYQHIKEYIREEVLPAYDQNTITFLLKLSILSSFNPAICDHLAETNDALTKLENIEKHNSFLISLDKKNKWFRFHHLFGEALNADFERVFPTQEKTRLHKLASTWYEQNGYLQEAIDHAVKSGDLLFVDTFLDRNAENRILIGQLNQLFEWFQKIERGNIKLPMVNIWIAWVNIFSHKVDATLIESLLSDSIRIYENDSNNKNYYPIFIAHITAIKGFVATYKCNFHEGIALSLQALQELTVDNKSLRSGIIFNLSRSYYLLGDIDKTIEYADQATRLGFECNNFYCAVASVNLKAQTLMQLMEFDQAETVYRDCLAIITASKLNKHPVNGYIYNGLGEIQFYRNNIEDAKELLSTGMIFCEHGKETRSLLQATKLMCQVYQTQGDRENLKKYTNKLGLILKNISADLSVREISAFQVDMNLLADDFTKISQWEKGLSDKKSDTFTLTDEYENFVRANVLLVQKRFDEALSITDDLIATATLLRRKLSLTKLQLCKSRILFAKGATEDAVHALMESLQLCAAHGAEILFQQAKNWLSFDLPKDISSFEAINFIGSTPIATPTDECIIQKQILTSREIDILRGVKTGLSNKQISDRFNIAEGTVKRHIHNIFNKLNVKNRIEALQHFSTYEQNHLYDADN